MNCMARLNRNAARLMHKYHAHGATDVTGFGILGHARNLASNQKRNVSFVLHTLPILANMVKVFRACGINFKLLEGFSAETSGTFEYCILCYCSFAFMVAKLLRKCGVVIKQSTFTLLVLNIFL